jgi:hypothetical protein
MAVDSRSYSAAVNQKLLFARKLLNLAKAYGDSNKHTAIAMAQSVVLQLYLVWNWHLQDIANNYKVQDPSVINCADDLVTALSADGKTPAEAMELQHLFNTEDTWVNDLMSAYQTLFRLPATRKAQMDVDRLPLLSLDNAATDHEIKWDLIPVVEWTEKMTELVERHRDMMIEF